MRVSWAPSYTTTIWGVWTPPTVYVHLKLRCMDTSSWGIPTFQNGMGTEKLVNLLVEIVFVSFFEHLLTSHQDHPVNKEKLQLHAYEWERHSQHTNEPSSCKLSSLESYALLLSSTPLSSSSLFSSLSWSLLQSSSRLLSCYPCRFQLFSKFYLIFFLKRERDMRTDILS